MYWLYFARDFYRPASASVAQQKPTPTVPYSAPAPKVAAVVFRELPAAPKAEEKSIERVKHAAKRQPEYVVRSEEVAPPTSAPAKRVAEPASPLNTYLQRLSVDGDHAFGLWDEDAGFSVFSANFERVTGFASGECAGHDWIHLIHHTQQYAVNEALLQAIEGMDARCLVQAQRLKDGAETRWLMLDVKAPRGSQSQIMVLFRDLTEQRALEEVLEQTESALAVSERSRAAFLSSMSHELRTPLNAIMGFAEMMRAGVFGELNNPTYAEYAKHIHESGGKLLGKINDLLDIADMDSGGLEIFEEEFQLSAMLIDAIEIHTHHAFERQQNIRLDCPHKLEIVGDRTKLMSAVTHLITNALRHSADGTEVIVTVRIQMDEGVIISVRDTGEGIPTAQLEVIRSALAAEVAYFRIESGGIGLGLSLSKELASRHGGRVMIDSIRHHGTVVSLILPANRVISGMPQKRRRSN